MRITRALAVLAVLACAVPLAAEIEPGDKAPNFKFNQKWNTPDGCDQLNDYRGKLVLLVRFATYSQLSMERMPDLEKLGAKYREQGVEICATSEEPHADIQRVMIDQKKFTFGVIQADIKRLYQHEMFPHSWMIDPKGVVLWRGQPLELKEEMITRWLALFPAPKIVRKLAKDLDDAVKLFNKGEIGSAWAEADKINAIATAEEVKKDCAFVVECCKKHLAAFEQQIKDTGKNLVERVKVMQAGAAKLKGSQVGDQWARDAAKLRESKDYEGYVELEALKPQLEEMKPFAARKKLEALVKKYPDTEAAKDAEALIKRYAD